MLGFVMPVSRWYIPLAFRKNAPEVARTRAKVLAGQFVRYWPESGHHRNHYDWAKHIIRGVMVRR